MTNDDEFVAYLAGDDAATLDDPTRSEVDRLRSLLADEAVWSPAPAELEDAIVAAISDQAVSNENNGAAPLATQRASRRAQRDGRRSWGGRRAMLAAAAAVVTITAAGVVATRGDDDREMLQVAFDGNAGTATLTKFDSGWQIVLDADGLERRADGEFYEAWLRNPEGVLVSIGTFNEADHVVLWAGVSPREFSTITVTRETADGDPASSGDRVLIGTIDVG